jgi:glyoxylase-like metal-dependent hydrolase (beta-lactamase superfamily II)
LARGGEGQAAPPADALPTDTYFVEFYKLSHYFNGEGVQLFHIPTAHTDGDSIVHFRGTDVIALGDLMSTGSYPVIDVAKGGTINGVIEGLNRVLDMSIAEFRLEGGTLMVPGHGRLVDSADVAYYRDMLTIIRDRVEDLIKKGRTLEQVRAASPSGDYDTEYGSTTGPWTTADFIEAVYKTLGGGKPPAAPARRR